MNNLFLYKIFENPQLYGSWAVLIVFSVFFHELSHALAAKLLGDSTAADAGHITLNPLKQMGWTALILLLLLGITWGQVPVNPRRLTRKGFRVTVSLAGVLANFLLAVIFAIFAAIAIRADSHLLANFFTLGTLLNIILALFNLLPVPPLDGFAALREIFPHLDRFNTTEFGKGTMLFLFFAVFYFGVNFIYNVGLAAAESLITFIMVLFA